MSPEALAGGPIGRVRDGDLVAVEIDRVGLVGRVDVLGLDGQELAAEEVTARLATRPPHPGLAAARDLPDDTRLWAALQQVSGGVWTGCGYDADRIIAVLDAGRRALDEP